MKAGDLIVLYTKKGTDTQRLNDDGTTTFFFYLGAESTLWNKPEDTAVILEINSSNYKDRGDIAT